jgi:hypothetical protein
MKSELSAEALAALASLANIWPSLRNDVDRALAVAKLKVSTRVLAEHLGPSEAHIRNYRLMAKASSRDQLLARKGKISSRELVRRSKLAEAERKIKDKEALDRKRTEEAQKACKTICDWLEGKGLWSSHCENIIDETRRILYEAEQNGTLPKCALPATGTPFDSIIERMRPPKSVNPDTESVGWYADWLARWTVFAFPDSIVRDRALNLAWDVQTKRR